MKLTTNLTKLDKNFYTNVKLVNFEQVIDDKNQGFVILVVIEVVNIMAIFRITQDRIFILDLYHTVKQNNKVQKVVTNFLNLVMKIQAVKPENLKKVRYAVFYSIVENIFRLLEIL